MVTVRINVTQELKNFQLNLFIQSGYEKLDVGKDEKENKEMDEDRRKTTLKYCHCKGQNTVIT